MKTKSIKRYGFWGLLNLIINVLITKFLFRQARIIRRPFIIRGKKNIKIGKGFTTGVGLRLETLPHTQKVAISIGKNVEVNDYVHIAAHESVIIKDNVLIASKVFITDHNHGSYGKYDIHSNPAVPPKEREIICKPVKIEKNVWIGEFVSILPGVTIAEGSIIGTMSVVSTDIPSFSIAVGSPAKVIKKYNFEVNRWEKV